MYRNLFFFAAFVIICCHSAKAEVISVSIFNDSSVSALVISSCKGSFEIMAGGRQLSVIHENEPLYVSMKGDSLFLWGSDGPHGVFYNISVNSGREEDCFSVRPVDPSMEMRRFQGNLQMYVDYGRISIINEINEAAYLAGVIEAEAGTNADLDFYQAQAVICRTYLYGNLNRHADEDFHLCDEVHCQVYKGTLTNNEVIYNAVNTTNGNVITFGDNDLLITAAFHSNCGGQTVNAEDVWLIHRPYLRSVTDPFCRSRRNSEWNMKIDRNEWESYLAGMGFDTDSGEFTADDFRSEQPERNIYYRIGEFSIPYIKIRNDWGLKSSFFDVEISGGGHNLLVRGRGYGHGVGLCQEGAMEMAENGYNFIDILQFYYTDIEITEIEHKF